MTRAMRSASIGAKRSQFQIWNFCESLDERDTVLEPGMFDERVGQTHAALLVGGKKMGARDHRVRFVVMDRREKRIERRKPRMHAFEQKLTEGFERAFEKTRADINAGAVLRGKNLAERRGDADPPLGVERALDGRDEKAGPAPVIIGCPLSPSSERAFSGLWDNMG